MSANRNTRVLATLACLALSACTGVNSRSCPPPGPPPPHAGGPGPHGPGRHPVPGPMEDPEFARALAECARELGLPDPPAAAAAGPQPDGPMAPPPMLEPEQHQQLDACLDGKGVAPPLPPEFE